MKKLMLSLVALLAAACSDAPEALIGAPTAPTPASPPPALAPTPTSGTPDLAFGRPPDLISIDDPRMIAMNTWAPRPDCDANYGISINKDVTETKVSWEAPDSIPVWSNENGWECEPGQVTHYRVVVVSTYPGGTLSNVDWSRWRNETWVGGTFCWPWTELDMHDDSQVPEVYDCGPHLRGNINRARFSDGTWKTSGYFVRVRWIISGWRNIRGPWSAGVQFLN